MKTGLKTLPTAITAELVALYNAGDWAKLAAAGERAARKFPRQALGWQAGGKALFQLGRMEDAVKMLKQLVIVAPADPDGYNDLASALHALGRFDESLIQYQRAAKLDSASSRVQANMGRLLLDMRRFDDSLAACQRAVAADPSSVFAHNNLGNVQRELGQLAESEASFRQALALQPNTPEALLNLGVTQEAGGQWAEARATFRTAAQLYPNAPMAFALLGRLLTRLTGDDEEAMQALQRAVALGLNDANIHVELGNLLMRQKQIDQALEMFRAAQRLQPLITWPANQAQADFSVLFLDSPMAGSTPVHYLAGRASYHRYFHCVIPDTPVDFDLLRGKADVVFNMICNADDGAEMLVHALAIAEQLDCPIVNHPSLIMQTDREAIAQRLAGIPGTIVPRTLRVNGRELLDTVGQEASGRAHADLRMPLLVRLAGTHGGEEFEKHEDWGGIATFAARDPDANHYLTEFADYRSADGFFRKYRVIFIDGVLFPYHLAIHNDWKVHHFRTDMADHAWMREEEERYLADMHSVFGPPQIEALRAIAAATGLDYGGIDCGLDQAGKIVMFEANASMLVHDEKNAVFAYKNPYIARIKDTFDAMLAKRCGKAV